MVILSRHFELRSSPNRCRGSWSRRNGSRFPVRTVLTIIAVALVAAMSVALVAPYFVDWSAQRDEIEARLSAITGANVSLTGPIELRLLPTPYLALGEGLVSAPDPDGAKLSFASARLELELVKLPGGQIRFSEIRLEKPVLTLTRGPDGALKLPPVRMAGLHSTGFDRLTVQDGRVKIVGAANGATPEISGVEIDAAAPSLDGPAHVSGQFSGPDNAPVVFRLASEKSGPNGTPLRVAIDAGPDWPAAEFDGALEGDAAAGIGGLRFAGAATLTGIGSWRGGADPVAGRRTDDRRSQSSRPTRGGISSRTGRTSDQVGWGRKTRVRLARADQHRAQGQTGQCRLAHAPQGRGRGCARARGGADHPHCLGGASGPRGRMAIDVQVWAQSIILGAHTLPDANVTLKAAPGAPLDLRFDLGLPGQTRLRGDGDLETGAEPKFRGDVDFASADFALLRDWAGLWTRRRPWPRSRLLASPSLSQRIAVGRDRGVGERDSLDAISS